MPRYTNYDVVRSSMPTATFRGFMRGHRLSCPVKGLHRAKRLPLASASNSTRDRALTHKGRCITTR